MKLEEIPLEINESDIGNFPEFTDVSLIPKFTHYCYSVNNVDEKTGRLETDLCPYWRSVKNRESQDDGYCLFLNKGDSEMGIGLLWDMVKECGENMY